MGTVMLKCFVGGVAGILIWLIFEAQAPHDFNDPTWLSFENNYVAFLGLAEGNDSLDREFHLVHRLAGGRQAAGGTFGDILDVALVHGEGGPQFTGLAEDHLLFAFLHRHILLVEQIALLNLPVKTVSKSIERSLARLAVDFISGADHDR